MVSGFASIVSWVWYASIIAGTLVCTVQTTIQYYITTIVHDGLSTTIIIIMDWEALHGVRRCLRGVVMEAG